MEAAGAAYIVEPRQEGQNTAARRGIEHALAAGATAVLLLSSDLPFVKRRAVRDLGWDAAGAEEGPLALAVPAIGRGGTNALYLRPPGVINLHFGGDSLALLDDAETKGIRFLIHESPEMALDLDEPVDLERLRRAV